MARVKQHRRTGDLHRPHQGGSAANARPNPDGKKKLAPFTRIFSPEDDIRILDGLARFVVKRRKVPGPLEHRRALKDFLKKTDYTDRQIYEKVRRLKNWYLTKCAGGSVGPTDAARYELSSKIWGNGQASELARREKRGLEEMRRLFPNLAVMVDKIGRKSNCPMLEAMFQRSFQLLGDKKAAELDAKVKMQMIEEYEMTSYKKTLSYQVLDMVIKSTD